MPRISVRQLLLSSAATLLVTTGGAVADELGALKAQLEALQHQVNTLEAQSVAPSAPEGASWIRFRNGSDIGLDKANPDNAGFAKSNDVIPDDRGWSIAITPVADLAAPVHEVSVSGYVKADFIYDADQNLGDLFSFTALSNAAQTNENVRLHARQSRFRIQSRSDTAVGQIRTLIETDFFGGGNTLRLRHAWGEWDMAPNWTFGAGQTWSNFMPLIDLPDTLDFNGPAGLAFTRQGQFRLTYKDGPLSVAVAVEDPSTTATHTGSIIAAGTPEADVTDRVPDLTGHVQFNAPGGFKFALTGVVGQLHVDPDATATATITGHDDELLWGGIAAASVDVTDSLSLTASGGAGQGAARYIVGADTFVNLGGSAANPSIAGREYWHASASARIAFTDAVASNLAWGYIDFDGADTIAGQEDYLQSVHANLMWQPVTKLKMGVEGMWAERKVKGAGTPDAFRAQFGTWFFF